MSESLGRARWPGVTWLLIMRVGEMPWFGRAPTGGGCRKPSPHASVGLGG